ncbi:MAG: ABC transporter permease [Chitinophagales bacterium]|nr:ABC transporter permease [Chitinophagales bacterium]
MSIITTKEQGIYEYLKSVYHFRHLVLIFVKRDFKVKYAQTLLGFLWIIIQPLTGVAIFTFFFKYLIDTSSWSLEIPYHIYAFCGLIAWIFFSNSLQSAGTSLLQEEELIKKVYFPKLVLPIVRTIGAMFDFLFSALVLIVIAVLSGVSISYCIVFAPFILILTAIIALSVSIWMSALTIRFRDFHHIIPYLIGFGIWLTPVFYPTTIIPESYKWLIYINPMSGVIELFRWSFFSTTAPSGLVALGFIIPVLLFISGVIYFRKVEKQLSDYL